VEVEDVPAAVPDLVWEADLAEVVPVEGDLVAVAPARRLVHHALPRVRISHVPLPAGLRRAPLPADQQRDRQRDLRPDPRLPHALVQVVLELFRQRVLGPAPARFHLHAPVPFHRHVLAPFHRRVLELREPFPVVPTPAHRELSQLVLVQAPLERFLPALERELATLACVPELGDLELGDLRILSHVLASEIRAIVPAWEIRVTVPASEILASEILVGPIDLV
jgi:hypothetical protein